FSRVFEYPLLLAAAAWLRPSPRYRDARQESYAWLLGLPTLVFGLCTILWTTGLINPNVGLQPLLLTFVFGLAMVYMFVNRPQAFGAAALTVVGIIALLHPPSFGT